MVSDRCRELLFPLKINTVQPQCGWVQSVGTRSLMLLLLTLSPPSEITEVTGQYSWEKACPMLLENVGVRNLWGQSIQKPVRLTSPYFNERILHF